VIHPEPEPPEVLQWPVLLVLFVVAAWAVWSYASGGIVDKSFALAGDPEGSVAVLRGYLERAGPFGPLVYIAAVVLEVVVAPIPGTLLYAPAGAIFGGLAGGTYSLAGNVLGAIAATFIARVLGHRLTTRIEASELHRYTDRVREKSLLVIALLRLNPLTSSDLVSYAAGLVGISPWRVGLATFIGMTPLCYAQAYAAEKIFRILPGSGLLLLALAVAYIGAVLVFVLRRAGR
jgi:uncharacterized membrane protein YdjX (TVP38/TMEM64 family)